MTPTLALFHREANCMAVYNTHRLAESYEVRKQSENPFWQSSMLLLLQKSSCPNFSCCGRATAVPRTHC